MKHWTGYVFIFLLFALVSPVYLPFSASHSKQTETITATVILDRWAHAIGGRDLLRNIRNIYTRSTYQGTAGTGSVEEWQTSSGQRKQSNNLTTGYEINVFNGLTGWVSLNRRVREFSDDERKGALSPAYIGSYSHLISGRLPGTAEYLGEDNANESYVLRITPRGGIPNTLYVDKKTHLPIRHEQQLPRTRLTVEIKRWRTVGGIKIPSQLRLTTSDGYEATETIQEARINLRLDPTFFSRPPEGPRDYGFKSGQSALQIPIEIGSGHIFLPARINESETLWFALDTAASRSLLDSTRARKLGLKLLGEPSKMGAGGSVTGAYARHLSVKLHGAELLDQTFLTLPLDTLSASEGRAIDGILGYDFFHRFVVEIDYSRKVMNLFEPQTYHYRGKGDVIPFTLHNDQPYVRAKLVLAEQTEIDSEFVVDTGSSASLMLAKDFTENNNVLSYVRDRLESQARGVGGEISLIVGRVRGMELGRFTISQPITLFPNGEITAPGKAGNIGGKILRRFNVVFDYSRLRMILEPNERFDDPDTTDMSGTTLIAEAPGFKTIKIVRVREKSPAGEAGLKPQDIILSIEGRRAGEIGLEEIREMFKQDGRRYRLDVKSGSETRQVYLKLRKLI